MFKIPTILTKDELMDKAFHKASKVSENPKVRNRIVRRKKVITSKLNIVSDVLDSTLNKYITAFPSFNQLHRFEYELIDIVIGVDKIRKSLGAIDWARKQIQTLKSETIRKINLIRNQDDYTNLEKNRRLFYGRVTSILTQVTSDLDFLNHARNKMKKFPTINPELPTIVVAGFPNVGKSLLVKRLSTAEPVVAKYPFTTQQLNLGHLELGYQKIQFIDTPGLLDRSMEKRNRIERQAIMALEHLADLIIFIFDPSEHCGYSLEEQQRLFNEVTELFGSVRIIPVENKADIIENKSQHLKISALEKSGIDELLELIQTYISETETSETET
jgi:nucleolar GTP-binding protein